MVLPLQKIEGKYEILRKLGEGGMGAVYMVRHRLLDEIRVIKVMRPQLESDEENRRRFIREAKVAIKLRHPNIAQLYDFTMDEDGTAFIVLEYIKGLTLDELLKKSGPPALPLALEIAIQSLNALSYLHRRGFVHRDISPDNLMLSQDFDGAPLIKLIDLGIAKVLEGEGNLTATGMFLGKIRYSAPEQFEADTGSSHADARCDLYSFGMVLYELCTGRSPIAGDKPSAIIAGHLFRPPLSFDESDPHGRLPETLREVILHALEKKAENRIQSAKDFKKSLERIQEDLEDGGGDLTGTTILPTLTGDGDGSEGLKTPGTTQNVLDLQFGMGTEATIRTPAGSDRPSRLESLSPTGRGPQDRIATLLAGAEKLAQLAQFHDARLQLDIVLDIDPDNSDAKNLLGTVQKKLDEVEEMRRRETLQRIAAEIEAFLATGELVKAEAELHRAQMEFGEDSHLTGLGRRLELLQDQARKSRVGELVREAKELAAEDRLDVALDRLGTAELIDEGNEEIAAYRQQLEERIARDRELAERAERIAEALGADDLEAAQGELAEARRELGDAPRLRELDGKIQAGLQRREQALRREAAEHFQRGKAALDRDDPEAAIEALDQALALTADDMLALELKRQAETRRQEKQEEAAREAAEAARLEDLKSRGREAFEAERFEEAAQLAQEILDARADDASARELLQEAQAELERLAREKKEEERRAAEQARLDDLLDKARAAAAAGQPQQALELAQAVLDDRADDASARDLVASVQEEMERRRLAAEQDAREAAERERLQKLAEQAQRALDKKQPAEALRLAEEALGADDSHAAALGVAEKARAEISRLDEEKARAAREEAERARREAEIEKARRGILDLLERGELDKAEAALAHAKESLQAAEGFAALDKRLGKARQDEKRKRLDELLASGREALEAGRSVLAVRAAREALTLGLAQKGAKKLLAQAESPLGLDAVAPKEREEIEKLADDIEKDLAERDLVAAERSLYQAQQAHPGTVWVEVLQKRLEGFEAENKKERIDELLALATDHLAAERLAEAREAVEKVLLMEPGHGRAEKVLGQIEAAGATAELAVTPEQAVAEAVEKILHELEAGKPQKALQDVQEALREHGDHPQLHELRERAAQALLERERLDDTAAPGFGATTVLPAEPAAAQRPAPASDETTRLPIEAPPPPAKRPPAGKPQPVNKPKPISKPRPQPTPTPGPPARAERSPWLQPARLVPMVAVSLLLVVLGVWWSGREGAPVAAGATTLVVDALPWAEIESVQSSEGEAVELGGVTTTPLALQLPPGTYVLSLRGPGGGDERRVEVEVKAGASLHHVESFAPVDADAYFGEAGW